MADVGDDIDAKCPSCGNTTHVVVAKIGDEIASIECKQCGNRRKHPAIKRKLREPPGDPEYQVVERGRLADPQLTKQLARWLFELGANAPVTRAAVETLARDQSFVFQSDDRYGGLRYRVAGMTTFLFFDHDGGDMFQAFIKLAEQTRRGKALDALFTAIRDDVAAELGKPVRTDDQANWAVWRAAQALLFVLEIDDFIKQHGETITLWLVPWTEAELPALDAKAGDWIMKLGRQRREAAR